MFRLREKLDARIKELKPYRYRDERPLPPLHALEDNSGENGRRPPEGWTDWPTVGVGSRWKARDRYLWLCARLDVPADWKGCKAIVRFDFGRLLPLTEEGFEALLYIDGVPYQGVDANHSEIFLPDDAAGRTMLLQFRLWSGLEFGGRPEAQERELRRFSLSWLDEAADDLYFTASAALETAGLLPESDCRRHQLLAALDRAFAGIDWSQPGSASFHASLETSRATLHDGIAAIRSDEADLTVRCVGHTHLDVAWLWRLRHTREKAVRSFSTVLRLMEMYPEYVFLQTMPQLYEYVRQDYPEVYERIKDRVKEGRWEAGGAMWLEADCNLPSGESLVRQIAAGTAFFREQFGTECAYLWLPDVFGYCAQLPQVLAKSGIRAMMTTKISWNQYNRLPHDTFKWRAPDGSEIIVHCITTPLPEQSSGHYYTYNGHLTPRTVTGIWDAYRDKDVNRELLLAYGYGDGGGGPTREMLELRRRMDIMPGLPRVTTGRADSYFEALENRISETDRYVHTWDGELYLEYHRGTYTSQAALKEANRRLELRLRRAEWLHVWRDSLRGPAAGNGIDSSIRNAWTIVLRNQFHDILPGSCNAEVAADALEEYAEARSILGEAEMNLLGDLTESVDAVSYTLFNASVWPSREPVEIPWTEELDEFEAVDAAGQALPCQRTATGVLVAPPPVPALGSAAIDFVSRPSTERRSPPQPERFRLTDDTLETPHFIVSWNGSGQLTRIYDKSARREVLAAGQRGNVLQVFEDKPLQFDAWDIDLFYREKASEITDLQECLLEENGPLRAVVRFRWRFGDSGIVQRMIAYAHSRRIEFRTEVDWRQSQQLLKAAFDVDVRAAEATYDGPFAPVRRPAHWNTSWDYAKFETVGHQWADLSEQGYGVSLLNDGKYGYDIKDSTIRLSLLKSAVYPDPEADRGHHRFAYALYPHEGGWLEEGTAREAWRMNDPALIWRGRLQASAVPPIAVEGANVNVDAIKRADDGDGVIVRLHEFGGGRQSVVLNSPLGIASWQETDLLERPVAESAFAFPVSVTLRPYEIKTLRIRWLPRPREAAT